MAVTKNDSGTAEVSAIGVTSLDLTTFTVSAGSNLCLVVFLHTSTLTSGTSVVWDSTGGSPQTMTSRGAVSNGADVEVFVLINPHVGNLNLHAAWTTSSSGDLGAIAFSGVDQTTGINLSDTVSATGTGTSLSTGAVTSSSDGATVGATSNAAANINSTDTQTEIYRDNATFVASAASYHLTGTTNTHTWTAGASVLWSAIGVHVIAVAANTITYPQLERHTRGIMRGSWSERH